MIAFICFFFPSVVAIWLFEALTKNCMNLKQCIYRFCGNALLINLLCFAVKKFIFKTASAPLYSTAYDVTPSAAFNYIILAVFFAVVVTVFEVLISKKVKISVEDSVNEEAKKD